MEKILYRIVKFYNQLDYEIIFMILIMELKNNDV